MKRLSRPQRVIVGLLLVAIIGYFCLGHAVHPGKAMDEAAMGSGICILLVALAVAALLKRPPRPARVGFVRLELAPAVATAAPLDASARASPIWLQRFLN